MSRRSSLSSSDVAYSTSGYPTCAGVVAGEVEDAKEVGRYTGEIGCDDVEVREVSCGARKVRAATDGLPTIADGLPTTIDGLLSSPRFGDGERGGVGEEVGSGDEDPYIDEDAPCASSAPPAHAYSTVKLRSAVADLSSTTLSHAQPRPSSNMKGDCDA